MLRKLHSWPGLIAALIVAFMAITGAVLSTAPALDSLHANGSQAHLSVAQLAQGVAQHFSDPQQITRSPNGAIVVRFAQGRQQSAVYVDAQTGAEIAPYAPSRFFTFFTELHRSLFLGDGGRVVSGLTAFALLVLAMSGVALLVKRLGGVAKLFAPAKGRVSQRLHVEISRVAVVLLTVTALSGGYMTLVQFRILPDGSSSGFALYPSSVAGNPAPIMDLKALKNVPVSQLRELDFPSKGDPTDVFSLTTANGAGYVDQVSGKLLDFKANNFAQSVYQSVYMLHTGEGAWWFGLLLGLASLSVPVLGFTGTVIWWRRRASMPKISDNVGAQHADTIILVGSESNTSWGFAKTMHEALSALGHKVHTAPMNALAPHYRHAQRMFLLTATHGDGAPPQSADRFLSRLMAYKTPPQFEFAVLGFGDKSFEKFCGYAELVEQTLLDRGWHRMQPLGKIDRQSAQGFAQWGYATGAHLGVPLELVHSPEKPRTRPMQLIGRYDYGVEVQAPTTVFRFAALDGPAPILSRLWHHIRSGLPRFAPGDIVGIVPPGTAVPRYYSIASRTRDGFLEICVRRQQGGVCSEFLHHLRPGDEIDAFVEARADFRPQRSKAPVIMIGAGTGIAPFAGFIRHNRQNQAFHLYWGGRDPLSDFLYGETMLDCLADRRLARLTTAFSRLVGGGYVQEKVAADAGTIRQLVTTGAQIMVCGGRDMAHSVREVIEEALAPLGISVDKLRDEGRYVEDVY